MRLINSELVIADVSDSNPNVFYELAIRNAVKKPVIVIKGRDQHLPFDVYDKRAITLDMKDVRQWKIAEKELREHILYAEEHPRESSDSILSEFEFKATTDSNIMKQADNTLLLKDIKDMLQVLLRKEIKTNTLPDLSGSILPELSLDENRIEITHTIENVVELRRFVKKLERLGGVSKVVSGYGNFQLFLHCDPKSVMRIEKKLTEFPQISTISRTLYS